MWWLPILLVVAYVVLQRLDPRTSAAAPVGASADPEPLHLDLQMQISGAPDQVTGYLNELADRLQRELDVRKARAHWEMNRNASAVSELQFTQELQSSSSRMATVFASVKRGFAAAAATPGQPDAVRIPFSKLADGLLQASERFRAMRAPRRFQNAWREYVAMLRSIYEQISDWPARICAEATVNASDVYVFLAVEYDVARVEGAIEAGVASA